MYNGHDSDFLVLLTLLVAPAVLVFLIMTLLRIRRNKFHRQRIKSHHHRAVGPKPKVSAEEGGAAPLRTKSF